MQLLGGKCHTRYRFVAEMTDLWAKLRRFTVYDLSEKGFTALALIPCLHQLPPHSPQDKGNQYGTRHTIDFETRDQLETTFRSRDLETETET